MSSFLQKSWPTLAALALAVGALILLPVAAALCVLALICLVAIVRLKTPFWRNAALATAAFLLGLAGIEFALYLIEPRGQEVDAVRVQTPHDWYPYDPVVQYRPRPNTVVKARATYRDQVLYDVTYTIDASGARVTPGSVDSGPTYVFFGDSFAFSEGVNDGDTLASLFAKKLRPPAHVVNLGVPGWGPTHQVRAVETGLLDRAVIGKVAAVIAWVTPANLERTTGDASWLGNAPRYDFSADGQLHFSGSFDGYRWSHPLDGLAYLGRTHLRVVRRLTNEAQERRQGDLLVALVARLKELVEQRYGAPLILLVNGPEASLPGHADIAYLPAFERVRALGAGVIPVRKMLPPSGGDWGPYFIPHDGHPTPLLNRMVAEALVEYLEKQRP
jgi:hypothetical protein